MELASLYMREISLDHSSDLINKCMVVFGLSVTHEFDQILYGKEITCMCLQWFV